jgi:hypothetical protein
MVSLVVSKQLRREGSDIVSEARACQSRRVRGIHRTRKRGLAGSWTAAGVVLPEEMQAERNGVGRAALYRWDARPR